MPAGASALLPGAAPSHLPSLKAAACTACGACWTACPDGAIGVSVLDARSLLDGAAASAPKTDHSPALQRGHKALAKRLVKAAAAGDARVLDEAAVMDGAAWLSTKLETPAEAFAPTAAALIALEPMLTPRLFREADAREAAVLAIDPRACLGCGLCVAECGEEAMAMAPMTEALQASTQARWRLWEGLPDTGAETVARLAADPEIGPLPAWLASRHGAAALVGGAGAPGSGERLALRQLTATVERELQRAYATLAAQVGEAGLEAHLASLTAGADGLGRARFGVVIAGDALARRLAPWPRHPFWAPLTVEHDALAVDTAIGLAEAAVRRHATIHRDLREAKGAVTWADLTAAERASCPPVLVLGDEATLLGSGLGAWSRLLTMDLPVKVVLLDSLSGRTAGVEPALLALAHRGAAIASVSPAAPNHLAAAVASALAWSGPALLHVHAPTSDAPDGALVVARDALTTREHVLLAYDPAGEGVFGTRLTVEEPEAAAEIAPARAEIFQMWRELAGKESPFVAAVRAQVEAEVAAERAAELAALRSEQAALLAEVKSSVEGEAVERLTERLMALAGYEGQ